MFKFRIEFEVEPGNTQIDPESVTVMIDNDGEWEAFENVSQIYFAAGDGAENEFVMKKLPESQKQVISLAKIAENLPKE